MQTDRELVFVLCHWLLARETIRSGEMWRGGEENKYIMNKQKQKTRAIFLIPSGNVWLLYWESHLSLQRDSKGPNSPCSTFQQVSLTVTCGELFCCVPTESHCYYLGKNWHLFLSGKHSAGLCMACMACWVSGLSTDIWECWWGFYSGIYQIMNAMG